MFSMMANYPDLLDAISFWLGGRDSLLPVCHILKVNLPSFIAYLSRSGLADLSGRPSDTATAQDVLNCYFLVYMESLRLSQPKKKISRR